MSYSRRNIKYSKTYENEFLWVEASKKDEHCARCKWCKKETTVQSMGRQALVSHSRGDGHQKLEKIHTKAVQVTSYFPQNANKSDTIPNPPALPPDKNLQDKQIVLEDVNEAGPGILVQQASSKIFKNFVNRDADTKAVIIWCLNAVKRHFSYRDAAESAELFPLMFEDSQIAARMQLGKDKIGYTIVHGLAVYFRGQLIDTLKECKHIVVGFDESLNKYAQSQQMDVVVKFWNKSTNQSDTRYLSSVFLTSAKAPDLKVGLTKAVGDANLNKITQVSMDGPAVNFCMLRSLKLELSEEHPQHAVILEIGSCGLHNIHGAFKGGIKSLNWDIVEFLKFLFYLFHKKPSSRGHYTLATLSSLFPLPFCTTRWVENQPAAQRAIDMFPHLQKWVKKVIEEKKANPLNDSNLFGVVSRFVNDKLAMARLSFFITAASLVEPFLVEFQSEAPLAPLLHGELTYLTTNIMQRVVKPKILEDCSFVIKVPMDRRDNLLSAKDVDLGFLTKSALKSAKPSTDVTLKFMSDCKNCYVKMITKIQERSPLLYNFTRYITCLDPSLISSQIDVAKS